MRKLPLLAYVLLIVIGAMGIAFPGGVRICLACGSPLESILSMIAIVVGIVGLVNGDRLVDD